MDPTISQRSRICVALAALVCGLWGCGSSAKTPIGDASGSPLDAIAPSLEAGGPGVEAGVDSGTIDAPTCPASCDDKNDCTTDSCDPNTFQCVNLPVPDNTSCQGRPCTTNSICQGGYCLDGPFKACTASDQCHKAGVCDPGTGQCTNPNSQNGKQCDDGLKCTAGDQCVNGVCQGEPFCPRFATCDPDAGVCIGGSNPVFPTAVSAPIFQNVEGPSNGNGLVRTSGGSIFMAGDFFNTTDLGSGPITTNPPRDQTNTDIFIAEIDPSTGKATWTRSFPGAQNQSVMAFAANGSGQVGLVGPFSGDIMLGDTELDARSGDQYILGTSATDGSGLWARRVKFSASALQKTGLRGIAGDPSLQPWGAAFVLCGTANQDGTDLSPLLQGKANWQGGTDIVLAGLDGATGQNLWVAQVGGTNDEDCAAVAMDGQSNTYIVGTYRFTSVLKFGNVPTLPIVNEPNVVRMFVAKLAPQDSSSVADAGAQDLSGSLNALWAVSLGEGQSTIVPTAVLALGSDVVVLGTVPSGGLLNGVDLGGSTTFLARLDGSDGHVVWIKGIGVGGDATVTAMAEGANEGLFLTGQYPQAFTLGTTKLPASNSQGATFVTQLDRNGDILAAKGFVEPTQGNLPAGVIGLMGGSGDESGGSLLLISFTGNLDLGPPVGAISSSTSAICAATLAP
jgi:hypothetical protein